MLEVMGEDQVNEMVNEADVNGTGNVDYEDFIKRVMVGK